MERLNMKECGLRIRQQRKLLKYSREEIADKLGVTAKFVSDIKLGNRGMSIQTLYNIAIILNTTSDYILFGSEQKNNPCQIVNMLNSCKGERLEYAKEILRVFLLATEQKCND